MEAEEEVVGGGAKVSPQQCEKKKHGFGTGSKQPRGSSACMSTDLSIQCIDDVNCGGGVRRSMLLVHEEH